MVFSKEKWNNSSEMNSFIPVSAALTWNKVESSLNDAWRLFVLPLLGAKMADVITGLYNRDTLEGIESEALSECQCAVANLAFWYNFDELQVRITDQGFQVQESEEGSYKSPYRYQEDRLRANFKAKGFNAIDHLLELLETNLEKFEAFKEAPAYIQSRTSIVRNAREVDAIHFINGSRIIFLRLCPIMRQVEETYLQPLVGKSLYNALRTALAETEDDKRCIGEKPVEELRAKCAKVVVLRSIAQLIRTTGSLTDRGLYFPSYMGNEGVSAAPAAPEEAARQAVLLELSCSSHEPLLLSYIKNEFSGYFGGDKSEIFNRDNDGKSSFWA